VYSIYRCSPRLMIELLSDNRMTTACICLKYGTYTGTGSKTFFTALMTFSTMFRSYLELDAT
jgi:hypothetical protein